MNKLFLEHYMHTTPENTEQKYIFLTDDREIGFNIIAAGYKAVLILEQEDGYYNVDSFISYMDKIMLTGTSQSEYCYVPACSEKRINDTLEQYFKQNLMKYHPGWRLFKNKEYLGKTEYQQELKSILSEFIKRFEGRKNEPPDLNRFHKFNEQGKRIGVFDMEIVDYLIQTVLFLCSETHHIFTKMAVITKIAMGFN